MTRADALKLAEALADARFPVSLGIGYQPKNDPPEHCSVQVPVFQLAGGRVKELAQIALENEKDYAELATARIRWWASQPAGISVDEALGGESDRQKVAATGQLGLLEEAA
jgi:hypothetical protein